MSQPLFSEKHWQTSSLELAGCLSFSELQQTLLEKARIMGRIAWSAVDTTMETAHLRFLEQDFWGSLGLAIVKADLLNSGSHKKIGGVRFVFIRRDEPPLKQRFTVAHETAHLLLTEAQRGHAWLSRKDEERLCDDFASELLIPQNKLLEYLKTSKISNLTPPNIKALCRRFRVNYQPMLIALAKSHRFPNTVALLARRCGHPLRPTEVDFRVNVCPLWSPFFIPPHQRLRSFGLSMVVDWAISQEAGAFACGHVQQIQFKLWKPGEGSGSGSGEAQWQAQTLAEEALLLILSFSRLNLEWHPSKMKR